MRRSVVSYSLLALGAVAATTGFVAHRFLDRPGMTALAMVPANASAVVALDLVPAPDQILAFKSIEEMASKAPGKPPKDALLGTLLHEAFHDDALAPIAAQVDRSIAIAMLPKPNAKGPEDGEGVALMPVKDAGAIAAYLKAKGTPETVNGTALVRIKTSGQGTVHLALQGEVLIGATEAWPVAAVLGVAAHRAPSIVDVPAFAAARARALPSANLLVLVSPALGKDIRMSDWIVGSMTIHDTGLEVAVDGQTDDKDVLKAGALKPLGQGLLDALPRGAYGFFAVAQPGSAAEMAGASLDDPAKEMKKEIDLDLKGDVLPALKGNVSVAFYPSYGPDAGLDLLVTIDDANGADPAALARKLEKSIDDEAAKHPDDMKNGWKVSTPVEGAASAGRLADEPANQVQKSVRDMERSFFRPLTLSKGKTVAWATVGKAVVLASSTELLNRAVYARNNPSVSVGLSGDAALGSNPAAAADGQFAMAISMRKLVQGMRNTVDPSHMSPEAAKTYRQVLGLYDATTEPLALRARMDSNGRYHGYISVPLDWTKLPGFMK